MLLHWNSCQIATASASACSTSSGGPPCSSIAFSSCPQSGRRHRLRRLSLVVRLTPPSSTNWRPLTSPLFCAASATGAVEAVRIRLEDPVAAVVGEGDEEVVVSELEDLPEQWRRSKVAWLCKELPSHKHATFTRMLNAQRKWITQDDTTYIVVHCLRIRENEAAFRVYKWMTRQHWYHFNFALATKLADCLGKDRRFSKCREVFDEIIERGRVPNESTFHVLVVAYLSAPVEGCLEEACSIYNKMIQLGGYRPRLSLHNSLFRAAISKPGILAKHFLKQAEFIFHNLETSELEIQKDIYVGLIWLHSYQDVVDTERIEELREEMQGAGFDEGKDVLVSIMRACSKDGDVQKGDRTWNKLSELGSGIPSQAFVYQMDLYAKAGEPMKSLEIFRGMHDHGAAPNVVAYQKIIEVMTKAQEVEIAESLMTQFMESGLKPLAPCFIALMDMYLNLDMHDKLESTFSLCLLKCNPNRNVYNIYLDSLVRNDKLDKAEEVFNEMQTNGAIGTTPRSCNIILGGFLASEEHTKAEKICEMMFQKKYDIEQIYIEKIDYILSLKKKVANKPASLKLDKEQREILIGLLLGGVLIESDEQRKNHAVHFEFNENATTHYVLKSHIHERFYEWLSPYSKPNTENDVPWRFSTIKHWCFDFFADQFCLKGKPTVPKLIHRWLSDRILAYWYMYGGFRTSSGDILLKLKAGSREDIERIVKFFLVESIDCKVKRKGRAFWIGFQGNNAVQFWKLVEPYVLDGIKQLLKPEGEDL